MSFYADKKTHEELKLVTLNSIVIKLYTVALFHINYLSNKVMCYWHCFLACDGAELLINLTRHYISH